MPASTMSAPSSGAAEVALFCGFRDATSAAGPPHYPSAGESHRDADQDESDEGGPNSDRAVAG
ncbi:hypothetical protein, partial [Natrinema soli]